MILQYEVDPEDFEFWGGAKARMDDATPEQRLAVYERLEALSECSEERWSTGDVNDFVWFECDDIFYPEEV